MTKVTFQTTARTWMNQVTNIISSPGIRFNLATSIEIFESLVIPVKTMRWCYTKIFQESSVAPYDKLKYDYRHGVLRITSHENAYLHWEVGQ